MSNNTPCPICLNYPELVKDCYYCKGTGKVHATPAAEQPYSTHIENGYPQPEPTAESAEQLLNEYFWGKDYPGEYPTIESMDSSQRDDYLALQTLLATAKAEAVEAFAAGLKEKAQDIEYGEDDEIVGTFIYPHDIDAALADYKEKTHEA